MNHDVPLKPRKQKLKTIAVDLDGTLAEYHGWKGEEHIGEPVVPMVERVKEWIEQGHKVVIYTARASEESAKYWIHDWLLKAGLPHLDITNTKRKEFAEFWDDRAIHIVPNTGLTLEECVEKASDIKSGLKHIEAKVEAEQKADSHLESQVGGDHYKRMKIQPVEFCHANGMGGIESAVVKYISRHKFKNGEQDIDKAIHLLNLLKELEYK